MPSFEKVETQVDFPAGRRRRFAVLGRTPNLRQAPRKNRGKPRWSFLDGPITANNPMGVASRLGADVQGRLPAVSRNDRP